MGSLREILDKQDTYYQFVLGMSKRPPEESLSRLQAEAAINAHIVSVLEELKLKNAQVISTSRIDEAITRYSQEGGSDE